MSKVRFILVALICESPAILLWDGPITRTLITGAVAAALLITVRSLQPGETKFFVSIMRPLAAIAAVPALWMVSQVLPLRALAHPMWKSAEMALGNPLAGTISIDRGATILALGQYLSTTAVVFLSAAVAVDRQRAEWLLFALTGACSLIALIVLTHASFPSGAAAPAIDCVAMGIIVTTTAVIRAIERYEAGHSNLQPLVPALAAFAICTLTLFLGGTQQALIASGCGFVMLVWVNLMRRFRLPAVGVTVIAVLAIIAAIFLVTAQPFERGKSLLLAFATSSSATTAASERMLADTPLVGTGAGTFAALLPIYREIDDPPAGPVAATTAATLVIELGQPMFWLIVAATVASIFILFRASLSRRRDSFYPATGGSCLVTLLLLAFNNAGLLGTAASLIAAVVLGLAFAQSKSRTVQS